MKPDTINLQNTLMQLLAVQVGSSEGKQAMEVRHAEALIVEARRKEIEDEHEIEMDQRIAEAIESMGIRHGAIKPVTEAQWREYHWQKRVSPELESLGFDPKHIRRIHPKWNRPKQEEVFSKTRELCTGRGAVVIMAGERGVGKTQICEEIIRLRTEASFEWHDKTEMERFGESGPPPEPGRYAKLSRLSTQFKPLYADYGSIHAEELAERLLVWIDISLLVIDEIHEADDLRVPARMLVDIVDRRYSANKDTILITNHSVSQISQSIHGSILSRVRETGIVFDCQWKGWR